MIYTDNIHLISDNLEELHKFAELIGLKKSWFQNKKPRHPHYDIWGNKLKLAIQNGAVTVTSRECSVICIKHYGNNEVTRGLNRNNLKTK